MKDFYQYRYGFVWRVSEAEFNREYTYVLRWGFVFRVPKPAEYCQRFVNGTVGINRSYLQYERFRPGAIIDVNDALDMLAIGTNGMFIRRKN